MKDIPKVGLCHGKSPIQAVRHGAEQLQRRHEQHTQVGARVMGQGLPQQGEMGGQALGDVKQSHRQEAARLAGVVDRVLQELRGLDELGRQEGEGNVVCEDGRRPHEAGVGGLAHLRRWPGVKHLYTALQHVVTHLHSKREREGGEGGVGGLAHLRRWPGVKHLYTALQHVVTHLHSKREREGGEGGVDWLISAAGLE